MRHFKVVANSSDQHNQIVNLNLDDASDEELMVSYGCGDSRAFDELYRRNKAPIYRYFLRQLSQVALAEEFTHEVWLRVINARESYFPKAKFTTYLFQIAHNCLIDHFRKASTKREINIDNQMVDEIQTSVENNPESLVDADRGKELLLTLVKQLPDEQREVFLLKEEAGLSIGEIASVVNENAETVKSRMRYAVKKLKDGMQPFIDR
jgi:RNA polymerase sigma-70 factor (ECF subfamily)